MHLLTQEGGLYNIKTELEDLSLKFTDPKRFQHIKSKIENSKEEQEEYIKEFSNLINETLKKEKLRCFYQRKK